MVELAAFAPSHCTARLHANSTPKGKGLSYLTLTTQNGGVKASVGAQEQQEKRGKKRVKQGKDRRWWEL